MLDNKSLGKLTVDLNANLSGLKKGMAQAQAEVKKGTAAMSSALGGIKKAAIAFLAVMGIQGIGRWLSSMAEQAKKLAVLENTFKRLNKSSNYTFKQMEMGMLSLARSTGVSTSKQTEALQQLMNSLSGIETPQNIQSILLPIALDWAAASGKDAKEAAKDISDAFLGELPEDFKVVKIKYEAETGKKFDDLTRAEKWKLVMDYLQQFKGAAEAAGNTLGGSFDKVKTGLAEVLKAIFGSQNFDPLIGMFQKLSNSLFDLAERIKKGDIPPLLLKIQDCITKLFTALSKIDWEGVFSWLGDHWEDLAKGLGAIVVAIAGFKVTGVAVDAFKNLGKIFEWILPIIGAVVAVIGMALVGAMSSGLMSVVKMAAPTTKLGGVFKILSMGALTLGTNMGIFANNMGEALKSGNLLKIAGSALRETFGLLGRTIETSLIYGFATLGTMFPKIKKEMMALMVTTTNVGKGFELFGQSVKMDGITGAMKNIPMIMGLVSESSTAAAASIGVALGPVLLIIAAVVAAIALFVVAWKNDWGGLQTYTKKVWGDICKVFSDLWNNSLKPLFDEIYNLFKTVWNAIRGVLKSLGIDIPAFEDLFKNLWDVVKTYLGMLANYIGEVFKGIVDAIAGAFKIIGGVLGVAVDVIRIFVNNITTVVKLLVAVFTGDWASIGGIIGDWWSKTKEIFGDIAKNLGTIFEGIGQILGGLVRSFVGAFKGVGDTISEFFQNCGKKFGELIGSFFDWGANLIEGLINGVGSVLSKLGKFFSDIWNSIVDGIKNFFGIHSPSKLMAELGEYIGQGLFDGIKKILDTFGKLVDIIVGFFGDIWKNTTKWVGDMAGKFADHAKNVGTWVGDQAKALGGWVSDTAGKLGQGLRDFGSHVVDVGKKWVEYNLAAAGFIADHGKKFLGWITDTGTHFGSLLGKFGEGFTNIATKFTNWIAKDLTNIGGTFVSNIGALPGKIAEQFVNLVTSFGTGLKNAWQKFNDWTYTTGEMAKDYLGKFTELPGKIGSALANVASAVGSKLSGAVDVVSDKVEDMLKSVTDMGTRFWNAGSGLINSMLNGLKNAWSSLSGWFSDKLNWIRDRLPGSDAKTGPLSTLTRAGRGLFTAMQGGMKKEFPNMLNAVEGYAGDIKDALPTATGMDISYGTKPTSMALAGAGQGGVTIQINGGYYASDRALQDLVTTIDKELGARRNK